MTKERLLSIPEAELKRIASNNGLAVMGDLSKLDLINLILENFEEVKQERDEQNNLSIRGEEKKYDITRDEELDTEKVDEYQIPCRYNETKIVFIVRDPNWAFAYWDIEERKAQSLKSNPDFEKLLLRVHDIELVEFNGSNSNSFFDIPIQFTDSCWYIYLPHQCCFYILDLACISGGDYHCLSRSNPIRTPRGTFAGSGGQESMNVLQLEEFESLMKQSSSEEIPQRIIAGIRE